MKIIEQRIRDFLSTRRPGSHLGTEAAKENVIQQIVGVVSKHAPDVGVESWIGEVIESAMVRQKGNGWPSADVWAAAVGAAGMKIAPQDETNVLSLTEYSFQRFCEAVRNGQPVAEPMLFGAAADRALREGQFGLKRLRSYQVGAYHARRKMYGQPAAMKWLQDRLPILAEELAAAHNRAEAEIRPQHAADVDMMIGGEDV